MRRRESEGEGRVSGGKNKVGDKDGKGEWEMKEGGMREGE